MSAPDEVFVELNKYGEPCWVGANKALHPDAARYIRADIPAAQDGPHPEAVRKALDYADDYLRDVDRAGQRTHHSKMLATLTRALRGKAAESGKGSECS